MRLRIHHETRFVYDNLKGYALSQLRLFPHHSNIQTVVNWDVALDGAHRQTCFTDAFGNRVDLVEAAPEDGQKDGHVVFRVDGEIETSGSDGVVGADDSSMPLWVYRRETALTQPDEALISLATSGNRDSATDTLAALHDLVPAIRSAVTYETGQTHVATTAADALAHGRGVCQDHAHIFIACARVLGIPARYVSGYLMMNDRIDQDATHAWAEAHVAGLGWVGFDVSNAISPDERYVKLAHGPDYRACAPTYGIIGGQAQEQLEVAIQVQQ